MGQILVRKIDDDVLERLRAIAQDRKTSLEALARDALAREARQRTNAELREALLEMEKLRRLQPYAEDSVPLLRELREDGPSDD